MEAHAAPLEPLVIPDLPDDPLRRQVRAQLAARHLFSADGVSSVRRGTGRLCTVCRRPIDSPTLEREVEGPGVFGRARSPHSTSSGASESMARQRKKRAEGNDHLISFAGLSPATLCSLA